MRVSGKEFCDECAGVLQCTGREKQEYPHPQRDLLPLVPLQLLKRFQSKILPLIIIIHTINYLGAPTLRLCDFDAEACQDVNGPNMKISRGRRFGGHHSLLG